MDDTKRENIGNEQNINKNNFSIVALIDEKDGRFNKLKIDTDGNFTVIRPDLIAKVSSTEHGQVFALESDLYIGLKEAKSIARELTTKPIGQIIKHNRSNTDFVFVSSGRVTKMLKADNDHLASYDQFKSTEEINGLLDLEKDQDTMGLISNKYDPFLLEKIMKTIKTFAGGSKKNLTTVSIVIKKDRMHYYAKNETYNTELKIIVMAVQEN